MDEQGRKRDDDPNNAVTPEGLALLAEVSRVLDDACDVTPRHVTSEELIRTDWPERIQPAAARALDLMHRRARLAKIGKKNEPTTS